MCAIISFAPVYPCEAYVSSTDRTSGSPAQPTARVNHRHDMGGRDSTNAGGKTPPQPVSWWQISFICSALLLEGMTSSSINVQVSALRDDFGLSPSLLQLVVGAFLVAYAGLLPMAGRLVDADDRRTVFIRGVALFGLGCGVCAAAMSGWWLVLGRFIQGAGAALSAPAALALITANLPAGRVRNRALGLYSSMGNVGFSLGLVLPGFLVSEWGWRVSFLVYLPLVAAVLVVGRTLAPSTGSRGSRVNIVSAAALTGSMVLTVSAVGGVGNSPALAVQVQLVGAVALGVLVIARDRHGEVRTFPIEVLRSSRVLSACVALAGVFAAIVTSMYLAGLVLALHGRYTTFAVGLALVPQSISNASVAAAGARLVTRFGSGGVPVLVDEANQDARAQQLAGVRRRGCAGCYLL